MASDDSDDEDVDEDDEDDGDYKSSLLSSLVLQYPPPGGANGENVNMCAVSVLRICILCALVAANPSMFILRNPCLYTFMFWGVVLSAVLAFYRVSTADPGYLHRCPSIMAEDYRTAALGSTSFASAVVDFSSSEPTGSNPSAEVKEVTPASSSSLSTSASSSIAAGLATAAAAAPLGLIELTKLGKGGKSDGVSSFSDTGTASGGAGTGTKDLVLALDEQQPITPVNAPKGSYVWVDGGLLQYGKALRFCKVCQMWQPLRTKHCRECRRCVLTHDHHCPWIGTCVGEKNRQYFFLFLSTQLLELCWAAVELIRPMVTTTIPLEWVLLWIASVLMLALCIILVVFVSCMWTYQAFLAATNLTTWEHVSGNKVTYLRDHEEGFSPFTKGVKHNLYHFFFPPLHQLSMTHWEPFGDKATPNKIEKIINHCC